MLTVGRMVVYLLSTESYKEVCIHMDNHQYTTSSKTTDVSKDVAEDLAQWENCYENMRRIIAERHKDLKFNMYR